MHFQRLMYIRYTLVHCICNCDTYVTCTLIVYYMYYPVQTPSLVQELTPLLFVFRSLFGVCVCVCVYVCWGGGPPLTMYQLVGLFICFVDEIM